MGRNRMMVEIPIPQEWKRLWNTWDLRGFIILSLSLQTFLILFAPLRKKVNSIWLMMPLWSAYLLADWAANFAVGLISNSQGNPDLGAGKKVRKAIENEDLLAFWAPFLLVHLGGPDTITAFALEDNELWIRHLLGLVFQCIAAIYVFVQSLPRNRLWIPTMLMFMTGMIKYAERTRSLYLASADRFKDSMLTQADPGPNYAKLMDEYNSKMAARLPSRIEMVSEPDRAAKSAKKAKKGTLTELEMVQYAYQFFEKFKGLVVDMIFSRKERNQSRDFFLNRTAEDAFKVVEIELNFIYEVLFTKLPVVFGRYGAVSRFFSFAAICASIVLFIFENKSNFSNVDITITYGLLFGALTLDLIALIMLLFSDWTIISLRKSPDLELDKSLKTKFVSAFLRLLTEGKFHDPKKVADASKASKTGANETGKGTVSMPSQDPNKEPGGSKPSKTQAHDTISIEERTPPQDPNKGSGGSKGSTQQAQKLVFLKRRWSKSVSTFNLINYCLHPRSELQQYVYDKVGISGLLDGITYVTPKKFTKELRDFIFEELKSKSDLADDLETAKEISSARGDWVLRVVEGWSSLLPHVVDVDYDQSLLLWHIATELCYNTETEKQQHQETAKLLSDYMLYLLIMQPTMMSAVAGIGQIRFRDTCAEVRRLLDETKKERLGTDEIREACNTIFAVSTKVPPVTIKGDQSKSLLFDGRILAEKLKELEAKQGNEGGSENGKNKWLIISKVWVELLCYGATHSRANYKAAQVCKGGELITIVWLLMTHFGLSDQFQINEGQTRAKLIVGK